VRAAPRQLAVELELRVGARLGGRGGPDHGDHPGARSSDTHPSSAQPRLENPPRTESEVEPVQHGIVVLIVVGGARDVEPAEQRGVPGVGVPGGAAQGTAEGEGSHRGERKYL